MFLRWAYCPASQEDSLAPSSRCSTPPLFRSSIVTHLSCLRAWTSLLRLWPTRRPLTGRPLARRQTLSFDRLEERTVPAVLDLTHAGDSGFLNTAFFEQVDPQATGTGLIK